PVPPSGVQTYQAVAVPAVGLLGAANLSPQDWDALEREAQWDAMSQWFSGLFDSPWVLIASAVFVFFAIAMLFQPEIRRASRRMRRAFRHRAEVLVQPAASPAAAQQPSVASAPSAQAQLAEALAQLNAEPQSPLIQPIGEDIRAFQRELTVERALDVYQEIATSYGLSPTDGRGRYHDWPPKRLLSDRHAFGDVFHTKVAGLTASLSFLKRSGQKESEATVQKMQANAKRGARDAIALQFLEERFDAGEPLSEPSATQPLPTAPSAGQAGATTPPTILVVDANPVTRLVPLSTVYRLETDAFDLRQLEDRLQQAARTAGRQLDTALTVRLTGGTQYVGSGARLKDVDLALQHEGGSVDPDRLGSVFLEALHTVLNTRDGFTVEPLDHPDGPDGLHGRLTISTPTGQPITEKLLDVHLVTDWRLAAEELAHFYLYWMIDPEHQDPIRALKGYLAAEYYAGDPAVWRRMRDRFLTIMNGDSAQRDQALENFRNDEERTTREKALRPLLADPTDSMLDGFARRLSQPLQPGELAPASIAGRLHSPVNIPGLRGIEERLHAWRARKEGYTVTAMTETTTMVPEALTQPTGWATFRVAITPFAAWSLLSVLTYAGAWVAVDWVQSPLAVIGVFLPVVPWLLMVLAHILQARAPNADLRRAGYVLQERLGLPLGLAPPTDALLRSPTTQHMTEADSIRSTVHRLYSELTLMHWTHPEHLRSLDEETRRRIQQLSKDYLTLQRRPANETHELSRQMLKELVAVLAKVPDISLKIWALWPQFEQAAAAAGVPVELPDEVRHAMTAALLNSGNQALHDAALKSFQDYLKQLKPVATAHQLARRRATGRTLVAFGAILLTALHLQGQPAAPSPQSTVDKPQPGLVAPAGAPAQPVAPAPTDSTGRTSETVNIVMPTIISAERPPSAVTMTRTVAVDTNFVARLSNLSTRELEREWRKRQAEHRAASGWLRRARKAASSSIGRRLAFAAAPLERWWVDQEFQASDRQYRVEEELARRVAAVMANVAPNLLNQTQSLLMIGVHSDPGTTATDRVEFSRADGTPVVVPLGAQPASYWFARLSSAATNAPVVNRGGAVTLPLPFTSTSDITPADLKMIFEEAVKAERLIRERTRQEREERDRESDRLFRWMDVARAAAHTFGWQAEVAVLAQVPGLRSKDLRDTTVVGLIEPSEDKTHPPHESEEKTHPLREVVLLVRTKDGRAFEVGVRRQADGEFSYVVRAEVTVEKTNPAADVRNEVTIRLSDGTVVPHRMGFLLDSLFKDASLRPGVTTTNATEPELILTPVPQPPGMKLFDHRPMLRKLPEATPQPSAPAPTTPPSLRPPAPEPSPSTPAEQPTSPTSPALYAGGPSTGPDLGTGSRAGAGGAWFANPTYLRWMAWWLEPLVAFGVPWLLGQFGVDLGSTPSAVASGTIFWLPHLFRGPRVLFSGPVLGLSVATAGASVPLVTRGWDDPVTIGVLSVLTIAHLLLNRRAAQAQRRADVVDRKLSRLVDRLDALEAELQYGAEILDATTVEGASARLRDLEASGTALTPAQRRWRDRYMDTLGLDEGIEDAVVAFVRRASSVAIADLLLLRYPTELDRLLPVDAPVTMARLFAVAAAARVTRGVGAEAQVLDELLHALDERWQRQLSDGVEASADDRAPIDFDTLNDPAYQAGHEISGLLSNLSDDFVKNARDRLHGLIQVHEADADHDDLVALVGAARLMLSTPVFSDEAVAVSDARNDVRLTPQRIAQGVIEVARRGLQETVDAAQRYPDNAELQELARQARELLATLPASSAEELSISALRAKQQADSTRAATEPPAASPAPTAEGPAAGAPATKPQPGARAEAPATTDEGVSGASRATSVRRFVPWVAALLAAAVLPALIWYGMQPSSQVPTTTPQPEATHATTPQPTTSTPPASTPPATAEPAAPTVVIDAEGLALAQDYLAQAAPFVQTMQGWTDAALRDKLPTLEQLHRDVSQTLDELRSAQSTNATVQKIGTGMTTLRGQLDQLLKRAKDSGQPAAPNQPPTPPTPRGGTGGVLYTTPPGVAMALAGFGVAVATGSALLGLPLTLLGAGWLIWSQRQTHPRAQTPMSAPATTDATRSVAAPRGQTPRAADRAAQVPSGTLESGTGSIHSPPATGAPIPLTSRLRTVIPLVILLGELSLVWFGADWAFGALLPSTDAGLIQQVVQAVLGVKQQVLAAGVPAPLASVAALGAGGLLVGLHVVRLLTFLYQVVVGAKIVKALIPWRYRERVLDIPAKAGRPAARMPYRVGFLFGIPVFREPVVTPGTDVKEVSGAERNVVEGTEEEHEQFVKAHPVMDRIIRAVPLAVGVGASVLALAVLGVSTATVASIAGGLAVLIFFHRAKAFDEIHEMFIRLPSRSPQVRNPVALTLLAGASFFHGLYRILHGFALSQLTTRLAAATSPAEILTAPFRAMGDVVKGRGKLVLFSSVGQALIVVSALALFSGIWHGEALVNIVSHALTFSPVSQLTTQPEVVSFLSPINWVTAFVVS
ncbi:MAG TPA: hypothetical protein DDX89_09195, partial [Candidatus Omnitrophica bacterium]|nr:hypothetical protein [Candidatus Omnitrophota bacterium]